MSLQDLTNGLFELIGSIFVWINIYKIHQDKIVKGIYWPFSIFFAMWGFWNLYYYPFLDQWLSFWAGLVMATGNVVWVWMAYYYMSGTKRILSKYNRPINKDYYTKVIIKGKKID